MKVESKISFNLLLFLKLNLFTIPRIRYLVDFKCNLENKKKCNVYVSMYLYVGSAHTNNSEQKESELHA